MAWKNNKSNLCKFVKSHTIKNRTRTKTSDSTTCSCFSHSRSSKQINPKHKFSGHALLEFAIVSSIFLVMLFTIIDFALFGYAKLTMQHAVREGARYAITGRSDLDPDSNNSREAAILEKISVSSHGMLTKVMNIDDIRVEDINGNDVAGFGQGGDIVAIHLDCEWPVISPVMYPFFTDGVYKFTVSTAMKNEAF